MKKILNLILFFCLAYLFEFQTIKADYECFYSIDDKKASFKVNTSDKKITFTNYFDQALLGDIYIEESEVTESSLVEKYLEFNYCPSKIYLCNSTLVSSASLDSVDALFFHPDSYRKIEEKGSIAIITTGGSYAISSQLCKWAQLDESNSTGLKLDVDEIFNCPIEFNNLKNYYCDSTQPNCDLTKYKE